MASSRESSGVLTFLFTDIEGSTQRWEIDPTSMGAALARHDDILRTQIGESGGTIFKHTGDGCLAVFATPKSGIMAAVGLQRAFATESLVLRIALHSGAAEHRDEDYFGPTLNRAARLLAAAHGGQVVVSHTTATLTRGVLPNEIVLLDLGEHRLRDITEPESVHQVVAPGLAVEFPRLKSERHVIGTLPVPRTSLVGRAEAVADLIRLVGEHRLVTLTGVGGTGKTRLSIAVADRVKDEERDGACFVDLAPVADAEAVPRAVAEAVAMPLAAGQPIADDLGRFLARAQALLVLDNCEHVLDAAADLVDLLLEAAPRLHILATSRESLGVEGERNWRVPSLAIDATSPDSPGPATLLFLDRAAAAGSTLDPGADLGTVTEIVRRLDGIPLAIELAAARTAHLTPAQILGMLDDRFTLLHGGGRRARGRQATLQATVDWSHDLLDEPQRQLLRRLAVFAGSFTVEAAAACGGPVTVADALDVITALVDKSLVVAVPGPDGMRYRLLETIRLYAQEKLVTAGEGRQYRDRHRDYFLAWSESMAETNPAPTTSQMLVEPEVENIRTAIDWSLDADHPDLVVRQVHAVAWAWFQSLRSGEADAWLEQTVQRADADLDIDVRRGWRVDRLLFAMEANDPLGLVRWSTECLTLDPDNVSTSAALVETLRALFMVYIQPEHVDENLALVDAARRHPGNQGVDWLPSSIDYIESFVLLAGGRSTEAIAACQRARADRHADPYWVASAGGHLVLARHLLGQHETAAAEAEQILSEFPDLPGRHIDLIIPAYASVAIAGALDRDRARWLLRAQLALLERRYAHVPNAAGTPLVSAAAMLALDGQPERAAVLLGGVAGHQMQTRSEGTFVIHRAYTERLQVELGDQASSDCLADASKLTIADLVATAHQVAGG